MFERCLGVSLELLAAPARPPPTPSSTDGGCAALERHAWSPDVQTLLVWRCEAGCSSPRAPGGTDEVQVSLGARRQGRRLAGVLCVEPGGGYGTRQLRFARTWGRAERQALPCERRGEEEEARWDEAAAVAVGLQQRWPTERRGEGRRGGGCGGGEAGRRGGASTSALLELLHELGHALHLLLCSSSSSSGSSASAPSTWFHHFGALQLPLDLLEVSQRER